MCQTSNVRSPRICDPVATFTAVTWSRHVCAVSVCPPPTDENPKQHVPLAEYAANLHTMVRQLSAAGVPASRIVLVTPPPLCEAAWEQECLLQGERRARVGRGDGGPRLRP